MNIYSDSKSAIQLAAKPVYHERSKHIEIDCHFVKEKLQQKLVHISYMPTQNQPADLLSKGLNKIQHEFLQSKLGCLDIFTPPNLRGSVE